MPASSKTSRRDARPAAVVRAEQTVGAGADDAYFGETVALWALSLFVLMIAVGFFAFRQAWTIEHGNEMSVDRALFTSINAATLTGFEQRTAVDRYKVPGQCVVMLETIVGSLIAMIVGAIAVVRMLRLRYSVMQIIRAACAFEAGAIIVGTCALLLGGEELLPAVFHAVCAFGNCGLTLDAGDQTASLPIHLVILPLAVLGGLGLPVLMELFDAARRWSTSSLSTHSWTVLKTSAGIYILATTLLLAVAWLVSDWASFNLPNDLIASSAAAINTRTLGRPMHPELILARPTQWLLMLLMMIGTSPAGTGGGIKSTTLPVLWRNIADALRGRSAGRAFGLAIIWLATYFAIVSIAFFCLLATEPQIQADRLLFVVISAASNVGLSHDPIAIVGPGLYILSATMLLGRLAPLAMLWWAAKTTEGIEIATA